MCGRQKIGALDIGTRKIGLAISDTRHTTAISFGFFGVNRTTYGLQVRKEDRWLVSKFMKEDIGAWIVGWPLLPNGSEGTQTEMTLDMLYGLHQELRFDFNYVYLADERFSTKLARSEARGKNPDLDSLSAAIILREFIESSLRRGTQM